MGGDCLDAGPANQDVCRLVHVLIPSPAAAARAPLRERCPEHRSSQHEGPDAPESDPEDNGPSFGSIKGLLLGGRLVLYVRIIILYTSFVSALLKEEVPPVSKSHVTLEVCDALYESNRLEDTKIKLHDHLRLCGYAQGVPLVNRLNVVCFKIS